MSALGGITVLYRHNLRLSLRNPVWVLFGLSQPAVFLVFFGPLMTRALRANGAPTDRAWQVFVPGVLLQLSLFGAAFTGFSVIADLRSGVLERIRVTPVTRLALLLGRVLRDVTIVLLQAVVLLIVAIPFGLRPSAAGVPVVLGFVALSALSLASISSALGLLLKNEDSLGAPYNTMLLTLLLLSGTLLPMSLAPAWLDDLSRLTPFRYVLEAMRDALMGDFSAGGLVEGAAVSTVLCALSVGLGVHTYRRQSA
jgi:ABC-2 type transport system permease protein